MLKEVVQDERERKVDMKSNAKRLKALGRKYAKQAFRLTEDDFVDLSMLERAYLNGYKRCLKELQERDEGDILPNPLEGITTEKIGEFLKDNIIPALHLDIDRSVFNEDYEKLLNYMKTVEYTLKNFKTKLEIAILNK